MSEFKNHNNELDMFSFLLSQFFANNNEDISFEAIINIAREFGLSRDDIIDMKDFCSGLDEAKDCVRIIGQRIR
jgi:hypothetical protein